MNHNDYPISFENGLCPACGKGKIIPHTQRDIDAGYICNTCGQEFVAEYENTGKGYVSHPLYQNSKLTQLLEKFMKEEE